MRSVPPLHQPWSSTRQQSASRSLTTPPAHAGCSSACFGAHMQCAGILCWVLRPCMVRCEPPEADAVNVRLEPGLAFGTGEHPTTCMCLRWLHARRSEFAGKRVMDYGTGGISQRVCLLHADACMQGPYPKTWDCSCAGMCAEQCAAQCTSGTRRLVCIACHQ